MSITDWHRLERPREKLLEFGANRLSDAELLAIFLRVGVKGQSAVDLAQSLLNHFGSLDALLKASRAQFCQAKGLGDAKYVQLQAVLEISRRHFESALKKGDAMRSPEAAVRFLEFEIGHQQREHFGLLLLDQQHQLIAYQTLFIGTLNQASVHPREVLKAVLDHHAAAVILAHNHPSGDPTPSHADVQLTKTLANALALIDVRTLDHLILGDAGRWSSLNQLGKMP
ncbi:MAG: DNA repair protein RadC [Thiotrichales bacterium]|nr:DNA repair protein RadC [Thiotrichales bacterium]